MSTLSTTNLKNPSSGSNNIVLGADGSSTLGTAKITTLADSAGANSSTPAAIANGTAKAWVNFNGTSTVAIRASYNVSSITDNGVGQYTVNFTTALADANYSVSGNTNWSGGPWIVGFDTSSTRTSSALPIVTGTTPGVAADTSLVNINVFR